MQINLTVITLPDVPAENATSLKMSMLIFVVDFLHYYKISLSLNQT